MPSLDCLLISEELYCQKLVISSLDGFICGEYKDRKNL